MNKLLHLVMVIILLLLSACAGHSGSSYSSYLPNSREEYRNNVENHTRTQQIGQNYRIPK